MISFGNLAICVAVATLGYALVTLWSKFDEKGEVRKKKAIKVANKYSEFGLTQIPNMLTCYAVGDWSGLWKEIDKMVDVIEGGEEAAVVEFEKVFNTLLTTKLSTATGRAGIKARLEAAEPAPAPVPVVTPVAV